MIVYKKDRHIIIWKEIVGFFLFYILIRSVIVLLISHQDNDEIYKHLFH